MVQIKSSWYTASRIFLLGALSEVVKLEDKLEIVINEAGGNIFNNSINQKIK